MYNLYRITPKSYDLYETKVMLIIAKNEDDVSNIVMTEMEELDPALYPDIPANEEEWEGKYFFEHQFPLHIQKVCGVDKEETEIIAHIICESEEDDFGTYNE